MFFPLWVLALPRSMSFLPTDFRLLNDFIAYFSCVFSQMASENEQRKSRVLFLASRLQLPAIPLGEIAY